MSTQFLHPNGTLTVTGAVVGAANAHTALSDSSNASYVTCDDAEGARVDLDSYTLGASEIVVGVQIIINAQAVGADVASMLAWIDTAGGTYPYGAATLSTTASTTAQNYLGPYLQRAFTQSELDELTLSVYFQKVTGAGTQIKFIEAAVGILVASAPTATVNAPTGAQGTPTPVVSWTFNTGSDGGPQSYYRVKVFSAAQYGAGGFDPATSTPTYDSGALAGTSLSHTVASSLANSTTWRAYVSVAHTINSTTAWSAWAYSGFTTSYTPSDVSSVSVTPDNTNGKITVTANRNTGTHAWATVDIERSIDGGTTWSAVRGATASTATNTWVTSWGSNAVTVVDYEVPNGTSVLYRARGNWVNSGVTVTGPWTSSASTSWSSTSTFIKDPLVPSRNATFRLRYMPSPSRRRPQGVFDVIGRTSPIVITDVRHDDEGVMTIHTPDTTAATKLATLAQSTTWLIHAPSSHRLPTYVVAGDITENRAVRTAQDQNRYWDVPYVAITAPADDT